MFSEFLFPPHPSYTLLRKRNTDSIPFVVRLKIWEFFACCDPKVIPIQPEIEYYYQPTTGDYKPWDGWPDIPAHSTKMFICYNKASQRRPKDFQAPAILHTTSEARAVGFKYYTPERTCEKFLACFNVPAPIEIKGIPEEHKTPIWVNWAVDTLVVRELRTRIQWGDDQVERQMVHKILKIVDTLPRGTLRVIFPAILDHALAKTPFPLLNNLDEIVLYQYAAQEKWGEACFEGWCEGSFELIPLKDVTPEDEIDQDLIDECGYFARDLTYLWRTRGPGKSEDSVLQPIKAMVWKNKWAKQPSSNIFSNDDEEDEIDIELNAQANDIEE